MAEEEAQENPETEENGAAKAGGMKLVLLAVVALIVLGGGGAAAFFMLSGSDSTPSDPIEAAKKPALYLPMKPPFVTNFNSSGRQRYVQIEITLLIRDQAILTAVQNNMPMLRNNVIRLMAGQSFEELRTLEGKELLRENIMFDLQSVLEEETGDPGIEDVLFTSFVMQ